MRTGYNVIIWHLISGLILVMLLMGCNHRNKTPDPAVPVTDYKDPLVNVNKKLVGAEDELIDAYIVRYSWDMVKTGTGLRYLIYSKGNGPTALPGNLATINYSVMLLNGDTCYSSLTRSFIIGKDKVEQGIDEGIRFMQVGDKAKFILPSHLAFGLLGDRKSIPQKATLVYDILLINIKTLP